VSGIKPDLFLRDGIMLADYSAVIPSVAAAISAFVAVVVAQFFKDHPIAKVIVVIATGIFAMIASGAVIWNQHQIIAQRDAEIVQRGADVKRKKEIRETIGSYIGIINTLKNTTADTTKQNPLDEANKIGYQLQTYLKDKLGQSYVTRMLDTSIAGPIGIHSGDTTRDNLWYALYAAGLRLEEFSREIGD
jgi:hypothetical protein